MVWVRHVRQTWADVVSNERAWLHAVVWRNLVPVALNWGVLHASSFYTSRCAKADGLARHFLVTSCCFWQEVTRTEAEGFVEMFLAREKKYGGKYVDVVSSGRNAWLYPCNKPIVNQRLKYTYYEMWTSFGYGWYYFAAYVSINWDTTFTFYKAYAIILILCQK